MDALRLRAQACEPTAPVHTSHTANTSNSSRAEGQQPELRVPVHAETERTDALLDLLPRFTDGARFLAVALDTEVVHDRPRRRDRTARSRPRSSGCRHASAGPVAKWKT